MQLLQKNNIMKCTRILTGVILSVTMFQANAQEFGVEVNGGLQGLNYTLPNGTAKLQPGGSLACNYTFPLGKRWGLITGIGAGYYATEATLQEGAVFSSYQVDDAGSAFQYNVATTGYKEKQHFLAAAIPVMLQYHTTGKTQWYLNAGGKVLLPFNEKSTASAQHLTLSGYYPDYNIEVKDLPQHGFGTVNNWQGNATQKLKVTATASAATGISFLLSERIRLYTGVYIDYGVTNMKKSGSERPAFVSYDATNVNNAAATGVLNISGSAKLMAYGIQVRLGFQRKKKSPVEKTAPVVTVTPVQPVPVIDTPKAQPAAQPEPIVAAAPAPVIEKPSITNEEVGVVEKPVIFATLGKTTLPENYKPRLDSLVSIMQRYLDVRVAITGHTCDIGSEKENKRIGEERALSVATYLQSMGIAKDRIDISSAGEGEPAVPNRSAADRSRNRRVTVQLLQ